MHATFQLLGAYTAKGPFDNCTPFVSCAKIIHFMVRNSEIILSNFIEIPIVTCRKFSAIFFIITQEIFTFCFYTYQGNALIPTHAGRYCTLQEYSLHNFHLLLLLMLMDESWCPVLFLHFPQMM